MIKLHALVGSIIRIEMYVLIWDGKFSTKQRPRAQTCGRGNGESGAVPALEFEAPSAEGRRGPLSEN